MRFKEELLKDSFEVYCETTEEARQLLTWLGENDRKWFSGRVAAHEDRVRKNYTYTINPVYISRTYGNEQSALSFSDIIESEKDLEEIIKETEAELNKLKEQLKKEKQVLSLRVCSFGDLCFVINGNIMGYVCRDDGKIHIIGMGLYEEWLAGDQKVNTDLVEWKGKSYRITNSKKLESDYYIFSFNDLYTFTNCVDDNITRCKYNNRPLVMFED